MIASGTTMRSNSLILPCRICSLLLENRWALLVDMSSTQRLRTTIPAPEPWISLQSIFFFTIPVPSFATKNFSLFPPFSGNQNFQRARHFCSVRIVSSLKIYSVKQLESNVGEISQQKNQAWTKSSCHWTWKIASPFDN